MSTTGTLRLPPPPPLRTPAGDNPHRRPPRWIANSVTGIGVIAAAAALVLSLTYHPGGDEQAAAPSQPTAPTTVVAGPVGGDGDKALCAAIVDLVNEANTTDTAFMHLGAEGSPERVAGFPAYQAAVRDWVTRIEPILAAHPDASDYLKRNMHRFTDDRRIYAAMGGNGPQGTNEFAAWRDELLALSAPYDVCPKLGPGWT